MERRWDTIPCFLVDFPTHVFLFFVTTTGTDFSYAVEFYATIEEKKGEEEQGDEEGEGKLDIEGVIDVEAEEVGVEEGS